MSKIIKGTLNVGKTAYSDGKAVITSIEGTVRDSTTLGFKIDAYITDQLLPMISVLPVSNFVPVSGLITYTGYVLKFNLQNEALLSGNYLVLPVTSIDLSTIKTNPANTTFYVYITMVQGLAQYIVSATELTSASYNMLLIGSVTTNASSIASTSIVSRSRLDLVSPSATAAKSAFPVSTGLPSQTGTISW